MGIKPETVPWWEVLPASLPGAEYVKKVSTRVTRVNLQVTPTQLKTIYFLKPGRGREEKTQKSGQNMGKLSRWGCHRVKSVLWTGNIFLG